MTIFDLQAIIKLDSKDYEKSVEDASEKTSGLADKLKSGLGTAAKVGAAAITAAAAGIGAIISQSVKAYADYEQLVGGVETLFKDNADAIKGYAENAYKTAGMSANEYMETVTGFSAALINSVGGDTEKAAELADVAITDMADNANKMGTDLESLQNAYRGFSRGNFTMLDNLALGFSGTKEGMQELLNKAQELSGVEYDISSYADMVEAIHVVQSEMGIAGTTSKEAASTISGSLSSMKSAWANLVTGISDPNADIGSLIGNLVDSAGTALGNLMPVVEQALTGVSELIGQVAPIIVEKLPGIASEIIPPLLSAAIDVVNALVEALPGLAQVIIDQVPILITALNDTILPMLPELLQLGIDLLLSLADGITQSLPTLIPTVVDVIMQLIAVLTDPANLSGMIDAAIAIIMALADGLINAIPALLEQAPVIIENLVEAIIENLPKLIEASIELIVKLVEGIIDNLDMLWDAAVEIVFALIDGIKDLWTDIKSVGADIIDKVHEGVTSAIESAKQWGKDLIDNFVQGIQDMWEGLKKKVSDVAQSIKDFLGFSEPKKGPLSNFHTYAPDMMKLYADGIRKNAYLVENALDDSLRLDDYFSIPSDSIQKNINIGYSDGTAYGRGVSLTQNIYSQPKTAAELMREARYEAERAVLFGV